VTSASAQLYWDTNGATAGAGNPADGTWDAATTNWSTDSSGSIATGAYVEGSDVVFSAGSDAATANITVSGTQSVSSLSIEEGDVTIGGNNIDDSSGTVTVSVASGASGTINSSMTFNANFDVDGELFVQSVGSGGSSSMTGTGTLRTSRLDSAVTINGGTIIYVSGGPSDNKLKGATINSGGTLRVESAAFVSGKRNLAVNTGGTFEMAAGVSETVSVLSGAGSIVGETGSALTVGGDNKNATFNGTISGEIDIVSAGTGSLTFSDSTSMEFVIGADGVSNSILGDGVNMTTTNLNGEFSFDLIGADLSLGNEWTIVDVADLNEVFGASFSVDGFTEAGDVWTNGALEFSELTGTLQVVPETSTSGLFLGLGAVVFVVSCRRSRK
tara:strand:- start:16419 stop:17576 length:1158 start_codon:yes stop_codon:yes gene_type:complete